MTVRIPTPKPVVPLEGYEWDFNRIGPYIRNKTTGDVSRLPDYYGPIPRIKDRSVLLLLSPALISLAVVLLLVVIRWFK